MTKFDTDQTKFRILWLPLCR